MSYHFREEAWQELQRTRLCKAILFTDRDDWTDAQIVRGYRSQHHVERAFRQMKGRTGLSWEPVYHWTDQKIRVHSFYCVLALTLLNLLHREAWQAGIQVSAGRLVEELAGLREVIHLYPPGGAGKAGRYRAETTYTELTPVGARLVQLFQLDQLQVR